MKPSQRAICVSGVLNLYATLYFASNGPMPAAFSYHSAVPNTANSASRIGHISLWDEGQTHSVGRSSPRARSTEARHRRDCVYGVNAFKHWKIHSPKPQASATFFFMKEEMELEDFYCQMVAPKRCNR